MDTQSLAPHKRDKKRKKHHKDHPHHDEPKPYPSSSLHTDTDSHTHTHTHNNIDAHSHKKRSRSINSTTQAQAPDLDSILSHQLQPSIASILTTTSCNIAAVIQTQGIQQIYTALLTNRGLGLNLEHDNERGAQVQWKNNEVGKYLLASSMWCRIVSRQSWRGNGQSNPAVDVDVLENVWKDRVIHVMYDCSDDDGVSEEGVQKALEVITRWGDQRPPELSLTCKTLKAYTYENDESMVQIVFQHVLYTLNEYANWVARGLNGSGHKGGKKQVQTKPLQDMKEVLSSSKVILRSHYWTLLADIVSLYPALRKSHIGLPSLELPTQLFASIIASTKATGTGADHFGFRKRAKQVTMHAVSQIMEAYLDSAKAFRKEWSDHFICNHPGREIRSSQPHIQSIQIDPTTSQVAELLHDALQQSCLILCPLQKNEGAVNPISRMIPVSDPTACIRLSRQLCSLFMSRVRESTSDKKIFGFVCQWILMPGFTLLCALEDSKVITDTTKRTEIAELQKDLKACLQYCIFPSDQCENIILSSRSGLFKTARANIADIITLMIVNPSEAQNKYQVQGIGADPKCTCPVHNAETRLKHAHALLLLFCQSSCHTLPSDALYKQRSLKPPGPSSRQDIGTEEQAESRLDTSTGSESSGSSSSSPSSSSSSESKDDDTKEEQTVARRVVQSDVSFPKSQVFPLLFFGMQLENILHHFVDQRHADYNQEKSMLISATDQLFVQAFLPENPAYTRVIDVSTLSRVSLLFPKIASEMGCASLGKLITATKLLRLLLELCFESLEPDMQGILDSIFLLDVFKRSQESQHLLLLQELHQSYEKSRQLDVLISKIMECSIRHESSSCSVILRNLKLLASDLVHSLSSSNSRNLIAACTESVSTLGSRACFPVTSLLLSIIVSSIRDSLVTEPSLMFRIYDDYFSLASPSGSLPTYADNIAEFFCCFCLATMSSFEKSRSDSATSIAAAALQRLSQTSTVWESVWCQAKQGSALAAVGVRTIQSLYYALQVEGYEITDDMRRTHSKCREMIIPVLQGSVWEARKHIQGSFDFPWVHVHRQLPIWVTELCSSAFEVSANSGYRALVSMLISSYLSTEKSTSWLQDESLLENAWFRSHFVKATSVSLLCLSPSFHELGKLSESVMISSKLVEIWDSLVLSNVSDHLESSTKPVERCIYIIDCVLSLPSGYCSSGDLFDLVSVTMHLMKQLTDELGDSNEDLDMLAFRALSLLGSCVEDEALSCRIATSISPFQICALLVTSLAGESTISRTRDKWFSNVLGLFRLVCQAVIEASSEVDSALSLWTWSSVERLNTKQLNPLISEVLKQELLCSFYRASLHTISLQGSKQFASDNVSRVLMSALSALEDADHGNGIELLTQEDASKHDAFMPWRVIQFTLTFGSSELLLATSSETLQESKLSAADVAVTVDQYLRTIVYHGFQISSKLVQQLFNPPLENVRISEEYASLLLKACQGFLLQVNRVVRGKVDSPLTAVLRDAQMDSTLVAFALHCISMERIYPEGPTGTGFESLGTSMIKTFVQTAGRTTLRKLVQICFSLLHDPSLASKARLLDALGSASALARCIITFSRGKSHDKLLRSDGAQRLVSEILENAALVCRTEDDPARIETSDKTVRMILSDISETIRLVFEREELFRLDRTYVASLLGHLHPILRFATKTQTAEPSSAQSDPLLDQLCLALVSLIRHRGDLLYTYVPLVIKLVRLLILNALVDRRQGKLQSRHVFENMQRVMSSLCNSKFSPSFYGVFRRYTCFLISDLLSLLVGLHDPNTFRRIILEKEAWTSVRSLIFVLLDASSEYDMKSMVAVLPSESKPVFREIYAEYKSDYQFEGKT